MSTVIQTVEALPTTGLTVQALHALDHVVPGQWNNVTQFNELVAEVAGEKKGSLIAEIRQRAGALERESDRYAKAIRIYELVDTVDTAAAGVAAVGKVSDLLGGLGFLDKFTPKPDTTQAVDAGLKLLAEIIAFGTLNGLPTSAKNLEKFAVALGDYARYDVMRLAAWVVFEGLIPLGPDFMDRMLQEYKRLGTDKLTSNPVFTQVAGDIPGKTADDKRGFIAEAITATTSQISRFVKEKSLTQKGVLDKVSGVLGVAAGGLDVVAAAIDASTTYYSHTGKQTVGRTLARHAVDQLKDDVWKRYVAAKP